MAAVVMMVLLDRFVNRSRLGRGIRATAQDPDTAVLMGVNIDRVVMVTFLLGGIMAGVAAVLYGIVLRARPSTTSASSSGIKAFTAAVLGGIGNLRGALLGGLLLGLIESYGASIFGAQWKDVVAFSVLVLVLMFRPTGMLGESAAAGPGHERARPACAAGSGSPDVIGDRSVRWWASHGAGTGGGSVYLLPIIGALSCCRRPPSARS